MTGSRFVLDSSSDDDFSPSDELIDITPPSTPDNAQSSSGEELLSGIGDDQFKESIFELDEVSPSLADERGAYHWAQMALQSGTQFVHGYAWVFAAIGLADEHDLLSADSPLAKALLDNAMGKPYAQFLACAMLHAAVVAHASIDHSLRNADVLAYLRAVGEGKFWHGLGRSLQREILSMSPSMLAAFGYAFAMQYICKQALSEMDIKKILMCYALDAPINNLIVTGVPSYILYFAANKALQAMSPLAPKEPEVNQSLYKVQYGLDYLWHAANALLVSEGVRQIVLQFHPDLMRSPWAALAPTLCYQLDRFIYYYGFNPFPVRDIAPWGCRPEVAEAEDVSILDGDDTLRVVRPSYSREKAFLYYGLSTLLAVGAATITSSYMTTKLAAHGDMETLPMHERVGYEAGLLAGSMFLTAGLNQLPNVYRITKNAVSSWLPKLSFFAASAGSEEELLTPDQYASVKQSLV